MLQAVAVQSFCHSGKLGPVKIHLRMQSVSWRKLRQGLFYLLFIDPYFITSPVVGYRNNIPWELPSMVLESAALLCCSKVKNGPCSA